MSDRRAIPARGGAMVAALVAVLMMVFAPAWVHAGAPVVEASPSSPGIGQVHTAINRDVDSTNSLYLRANPHDWNSGIRDDQHRLFWQSTTYDLICGITNGAAIGPYSNTTWHFVRITSGPGAGQTGYVSDRYASTSNKASELAPGEPRCGVPAPASLGKVLPPPPDNGTRIVDLGDRATGVLKPEGVTFDNVADLMRGGALVVTVLTPKADGTFEGRTYHSRANTKAVVQDFQGLATSQQWKNSLACGAVGVLIRGVATGFAAGLACDLVGTNPYAEGALRADTAAAAGACYEVRWRLSATTGWKIVKQTATSHESYCA